MFSERFEGDGDTLFGTDSSMNPLALFGMTFLSFTLGLVCAGVVSVGNGTTAVFLIGALCLIMGSLYSMKMKQYVPSTAYMISGLFWIGFTIIVLRDANSIIDPQSSSYCMFVIIWALFYLVMFAASMRSSLFIRMYHILMMLCLIAMAMAFYIPSAVNNLLLSAGTFAIIAGTVAMYLAVAAMVNPMYKNDILPLELPKVEKKE